ncbi:MAG TPA: hypothetical protein VGQ93_14240 [Lysobacter sp.]|jgi:hypothetical protein|nr:hypothetical protein [Lysobacter sp.]
MNLFKSELFSSVMLQDIQPRPPRYRAPTFGRRYGRHAAAAMPNPVPLALPELGTVEQIGDKCVLLDVGQHAHDQAA